MKVTVIDIAPPVADAGPDQTVDEGTLLTFDGTGTIDDVGVVNFTWTFMDGGPVTRYGPRPTSMFDNPGIFVITLTVTDAAGNMGKDTMTVTVNAVTANDIIPPLAVAGPDQIVDEGTLVTFNGSGCSDNVGVFKYNWTFTDGVPVTLFGARPTYRFDNPGIFLVSLNVSDAAGNWDIDTVTVTVKDITAPFANAGPDQTLDEKTMVMFNGSGSSDNVGIVNYTWTFDYKTQRMILYGVSPSFAFDVPGVYSIKLNVSDAAKLWNIDAMILTVRDITPPEADAGKDQKVAIGTTVNLSGAFSKDNVGIVTWHWNFNYDGKAWNIDGENVSVKFDRAGIYDIVLTVLDGAGNRGEDRVNITVVEPPANVYRTYISSPPFLALLMVLAILAIGGIYVHLTRGKRKVR
jgi:PKD repeat protein